MELSSPSVLACRQPLVPGTSGCYLPAGIEIGGVDPRPAGVLLVIPGKPGYNCNRSWEDRREGIF